MTAPASRSMTENEATEMLLAASERCRSCRHKGHNGVQDRCQHRDSSVTNLFNSVHNFRTPFDVAYSAGWVAACRGGGPTRAGLPGSCPPCTLYEKVIL